MDGHVQKSAAGYELRFERHFQHRVEAIWAAITQPELIEAWLAAAVIEPVAGGKVQLTWLNSGEEGKYYVARGTVTAFEPPRLVEYDTDLHGRLRWELASEEGGCRLIFTALYPLTVESVAQMLAGWQIHLDHLADALEGKRVDWPRWMTDYWGRWSEYYDRYAEALGEPH